MEIESERVAGLRVRVYQDEDPMLLDEQGDFLPLVVSVPKPNRGGAPVTHAGESYIGDFDITALAWAASHYAIGNVREEPTARYLWLAYGVRVKLIETAANGDTWWVVATHDWVVATFGPWNERYALDGLLERAAQFVRDYNAHEVYCYQVEHEIEWWEPLADYGSSDLVGYDYAVEEARRALAEAELEAPVEWPKGYPVHPLLWRCVAEAATLESFAVEGHAAEGEPGWMYWLGCGTNNPELVDADGVWVALLACATGAVPGVEPGVALECRDLVTADWSEEPAPLSRQTAEVVFHVAACGRAHR